MALKDAYSPGQKIEVAGRYRVYHYQHRMPHELVLFKGKFPECNRCAQQVRFVLIRKAELPELDFDFRSLKLAKASSN